MGLTRRVLSGGNTPSSRTQATGGESVVQITGRNQIAVGVRNVQRIWLPTPRQIVHLAGATASQSAQASDLGKLPPHTIASLLTVQIIVNSGTSPNVIFLVGGSNFATAQGCYQHSQTNTGESQLIAPVDNGMLDWATIVSGTVNYDLTVNLVAVEVQ